MALRLGICLLLAAFVVLSVGPDTAQATSTTPLFPTGTIQVKPRQGFANADFPFRWSVTFTCPGPDSIHTTYVEVRKAGTTAWQPNQRDGPFLGSGTFTTPVTFFPQATSVRYEWRVRWNCGATDGFAGAFGYSQVVPFTLAPRSAGTLKAMSFQLVPNRPKAGATLTARMSFTPVTRGTVACKATVARKTLPLTSRTAVSGQVACRWRVPAALAGATLRGSITVTAGGQRVSRSFVRRIAP